MRGLGQGVKQFKEGMKDVTEPIEESINPKEQIILIVRLNRVTKLIT